MINYSIVVLSCDKYRSLWPSFFARLSKYWTDTPAATYLMTNHLEPDIPNVTVLAIGEDVDWSSNFLNALSRIDTDYIYVLLEDVYVNKVVDKAYLDDVFKCITELSPNYVNTKALPAPRGPRFGTRIREVVKGSHYRASLCNAFWKKDVLLELIVPGETPWEFERRGSERSNTHDGFYGTTRNMLEFDHIIIGGKIARDVATIQDVQNSEINRDFTIITRYRWFLHRFTAFRNKFFSLCIPQRWQQTIRRYFE